MVSMSVLDLAIAEAIKTMNKLGLLKAEKGDPKLCGWCHGDAILRELLARVMHMWLSLWCKEM